MKSHSTWTLWIGNKKNIARSYAQYPRVDISKNEKSFHLDLVDWGREEYCKELRSISKGIYFKDWKAEDMNSLELAGAERKCGSIMLCRKVGIMLRIIGKKAIALIRIV
jgi:hypothetical protein